MDQVSYELQLLHARPRRRGLQILRRFLAALDDAGGSKRSLLTHLLWSRQVGRERPRLAKGESG